MASRQVALRQAELQRGVAGAAGCRRAGFVGRATEQIISRFFAPAELRQVVSPPVELPPAALLAEALPPAESPRAASLRAESRLVHFQTMVPLALPQEALLVR